MGIRLILRTKVNANLFRNILIDTACSTVGDEILISSGFFQEDLTYSASQEDSFISKFANANKRITTIGVYCGLWQSKYIDFVNKFKNNNIKITGKLKKGFH